MTKPSTPGDVNHLFHELWTKAVGAKNYDKSQWLALEKHIPCSPAPAPPPPDVVANRKRADLTGKIRHTLNCANRDNESNTPDYIQAEYLLHCLEAFERATCERERWRDAPGSGE
jgi:hypothetical protein